MKTGCSSLGCGVTLLSLVAVCYATTAGTEFQLVFMENIVEAPTDNPLEVHVSNTGNFATSVTVSSPGTSCPSETRSVPGNSAVRFDVCWWMRAVSVDYWPTSKTVLVQSNDPVMVYGFNKERFSADGFYAIPTNELAYTYFLASYDEANIAAQFALSATATTNVQITLPSTNQVPVAINSKGLVYTNGQTFTLTLNQYETFLGQTRGDLTGTKVVADQPIAVFSGNVRNHQDSGSRDHLAAQLMPSGDWGTTFALSPVPRTQNRGDVVRVIAQVSNTDFRRVFENGTQDTQRLGNAGDYYEFLLTQPCVIISSDNQKHLEVVQMVRSQAQKRIEDVADPAMFLLVPRAKWLNEYISPALTSESGQAPYTKNFAFISINSGSQNGLRIDGNTIQTSWSIVNGIANSWIAVGSNSHRFSHTSNIDFGVLVYGASDRESYGFALGADMTNSGTDNPLPPSTTGTGSNGGTGSSGGGTGPSGGGTGPTTCQKSLMTRGDLIDNDCDGNVDEESCNNIDDDNDGLVDEDCEPFSVEAFGNEYVIMFMENNVDDNSNAVSLLEIYVSAVDSSATVQYSLQSENGVRNRTILPGRVDIFTDLPVDLRHIGSGIDTKAISIKASQDVVVYGINKQTWSTDGFLAFPVDVTGTEYYTSHFYPGTDLNEFAFTPVYNDGTPTLVTVTMPTNIDTLGNIASSARFGTIVVAGGQSTTVTLDYGQTAQFQALSIAHNLNGARIRSNKNIAMFSGNVRARVDPTSANSRDHLVHQLAPVDTWSTTFVTTPIPRTQDRGDFFFITASQPNTNVVINIKNLDTTTSTMTETINNPGEYIQVNIGSTQYSLIEASRPVQVFQYVKTTGDKNTDNADPAMMLIPPVEQWSRNYQFATPRTGQEDGSGSYLPFETFIMIAIDRSQQGGLRLDNNPLSNPSWVDLSGSQYSATVIEIRDIGRHSLTHTNADVYFQALMYGRADRESYALPLGMRLVAQGCSPSVMQVDDGEDNDCDGSVDEELCNGIDDDADGAVDEDCGAGLSSGNSFFVTYMDNEVEYPLDLNLELYVAVVGDEPATVTVSTPLVQFPTYNAMTIVQPGQVQQYGFASTLRNTGQGITGNTVYVRANSQVVVYGVNKEKFSNDAFLVYPESSLGTEYYTCSWSPSTLPTEFAIVSTTQATTVQITLPNRDNIRVEANNQVYTSGQSFSIGLDRYQVYQAQSSGDLTGTYIRSSTRTAVFSGNVRTLIELSGSRDHLVQQMLPTASYGTRFYVVPFPERTVGDVLRIVSSQSNTVISVNGNSVRTINNAGGYYEHQLASAETITLTATNPVMVMQFIKSQDGRDNPEVADPSMFTVPSASNFITRATFITPVYSGGRVPGADYLNFLTLVIENGRQGDVRFNNSPLPSASWLSISSSNFVTYTFEIPSGRSHVVTTTSGVSFYGRLYGRADRESYAFPIGFSF